MKICSKCFADEELVEFIEMNSKEKGKCKYCGSDNAFLIDAEEVKVFLGDFISLFEKSNSSKALPLYEIIKEEFILFSESVDIKTFLTDLLPLIDSPIQDISSPVVFDTELTEKSEKNWEDIKYKLKREKRYLWDFQEFENNYNWKTLFDYKIPINLNLLLFRARLCQNRNDVYCKENMKCPPPKDAKDGRANPAGIPYLYLCKDRATTLYEIRGKYLDRACIGEFRVSKNRVLNVIDFTGKYFDLYANADNLREYFKNKYFHHLLSEELSRPLSRYDSHVDYVPTQFLCEYIRYAVGADGIIFESSLNDTGRNIVLFDQNSVDCVNVEKHEINRVEIDSKKVD